MAYFGGDFRLVIELCKFMYSAKVAVSGCSLVSMCVGGSSYNRNELNQMNANATTIQITICSLLILMSLFEH
jgi:hypothetical protein